MRHRVVGLAVAGLLTLSMATSAFAQTAPTGQSDTGQFASSGQDLSMPGRFDRTVGFAQAQGVPPVASGTFMPQVVATDPVAGAQGTTLQPYVNDLDAFQASRFGWRSSKPVTVVLYSSTENMTGALESLRGAPLTAAQYGQATSEPAFLEMAPQTATTIGTGGPAVQPGSWMILVNSDVDAAAQIFETRSMEFSSMNFPGSPIPGGSSSAQPIEVGTQGMMMIEESIARQFANLMITDLSGTSAPLWFREGLADNLAFSIVPGTPAEAGQALAVSRYQSAGNTLPTLGQLGGTFGDMVATGGEPAAVAQGISFLGVNSLLTSLNGTQLTSFLRGLSGGSSFESQLQSSTGFDLTQLNSQYQPLIPAP